MAPRYIGGNQGNTEIVTSGNEVVDCTKASAGGALNQAIFNTRIGPPKVDTPISINSPANVEIFGGLSLADASLSPTRYRAKTGTGLYTDINAASGPKTNGNVSLHLHDWIWGTDPWRDAVGHCWDCIRINPSSNYTQHHLIERVWARGWRDDFIESDQTREDTIPINGSLTIRDSLAEGGFAGISCTNYQMNRTINITNFALLLTNFFPNTTLSDRTFGPMFKPDGSGNHGPRWNMGDSVLAYETWNGGPINTGSQEGFGRVREAFRRMTITSPCQICVLASGGLPSSFPTDDIPAGMTVLTGANARNRWNEKRLSLIATIQGDIPTGGGFVDRNLITVSQSPRQVIIDRRLPVTNLPIVVRGTGPNAFDDEAFNLTIS